MEIVIQQAISPKQIEDAKAVRTIVFQEEQGIDRALDFDGLDDGALHFIAYDKKPIGAARVRLLNDRQKAKIERVAVLSEYRRKGIGEKIMKSIEEHILNLDIKEAILDSQEHAKGFYTKLGYNQKGPVFIEAGIPHVLMVKKLKK